MGNEVTLARGDQPGIATLSAVARDDVGPDQVEVEAGLALLGDDEGGR
jgi:hypothetical protein